MESVRKMFHQTGLSTDPIVLSNRHILQYPFNAKAGTGKNLFKI